jgi:hypothetical protein
MIEADAQQIVVTVWPFDANTNDFARGTPQSFPRRATTV